MAYDSWTKKETQQQPMQSFKQQDRQEERERINKALEHNVFDLIELKAQQEQKELT